MRLVFNGFHYPQRAFYSNEHRIVYFLGLPQRSGKSTIGIVWLLRQALISTHRLCWYVSAFYQEAKDKFNRMLRMLRREMPDLLLKSNLSDLKITLRNESEIQFRTGHKPDSLYGPTIHAAVLDEAGRCPHATYTAVISRLDMTKGPLRIMGNKDGVSWFADDCADPHNVVVKMTADDALAGGIMSQEDYDFFKESLPELRWREMYQLEDVLGLNPFAFALRYNKENAKPADPKLARVYGVDVGRVRDAFSVVGVNEHGQVCDINEPPWIGLSYVDAVERLGAWVGNTRLQVDSTGVGIGFADLLADKGFDFTRITISSSPTKPTGRQQILDSLIVAMQRGQVSFVESDYPRIYDEMRRFKITTTANGSIRYDVSEGYHDDYVFALALANFGQPWQAGVGSWELYYGNR